MDGGTLPAAGTVALLLADARLPSGGHAHSSGLEPALQGGMPAAQAAGFLLARARTTGLVDAATAVAARAAVLEGGPLGDVERAWAARTPSAAMRDASRELGRGLLRLAKRLWPESAALAALVTPPRPVVLGAIAAATGLPAEELVRLSVYDDLASAVAALLKLEPRDPADGALLVLAACASIEARVPEIAAVRSPHQIPALSAPQAEAWAEQHAIAPRRLFRG
ncbi:MAG: urease accessory protein [Microbacteriaceae bacterium]|nr:urease accessory protein [Microbacteriaceae bacterium]